VQNVPSSRAVFTVDARILGYHITRKRVILRHNLLNPMLLRATTQTPIAQRLRRFFGGETCRVQVAALPWREAEDGIEVMLITSRDTGRWVLPKGWPEEGEAFHEAAAREAAEEAGLSGGIAHDQAGSYYYDKVLSSGADARCEVKVFPLHVEHVASKWREKRQRKRKWMKPLKAAGLVNEPDLAELITHFEAAKRAG
jgi:8-oxo-dGTP pyrophosphatase MutT (NUDIX family)